MRPRFVVGLLVCMLLVGAGCQPARAGRRCRTTDWGNDGTHVLRCQKGRWRRVMTRAQAIAILQAIAASRTTTTTTPPTTAPPVLPGPLSATQLFSGLGGVAPNGTILVTSVSRDGRYVAAESGASNLVAGDTNGLTDAFLLDTTTGTITLLSANADGSGPGDDVSGSPLVTDNGAAAYFLSYASDLTDPGTDAEVLHMYRRDLLSGTTEQVGLMPGDVEPDAAVIPLSISATGDRVAVYSGATNLVVGDTNGQGDYFVYDVGARTYTRASLSSTGVQADKLVDTHLPVIEAQLSADGNLLFFNSTASTLVSGDTNGVEDVFVRNLTTETTQRVSVADDGAQLPTASTGLSISDDGHRVAFVSRSTAPSPAGGPQVGTYVRDLASGHTLPGATQITSPDGHFSLVSIDDARLSGDGSTVVGVGQWSTPEGVGDVRHVLDTATTTWANRITPACAGERFFSASNVVTCADGRRWTMS